MRTIKVPNHTPVGYLITRPVREIERDYGRLYYGIDRLPNLISPEPIVREALGVPQVETECLRSALEEWFTLIDTSPFIPVAEDAIRLVESLRSCEMTLELVFCEIAWRAGEEDRVATYTIAKHSGLVGATYGYDISWPSANHSAIFQFHISPETSQWTRKLNEYGLLSTYQDAVEWRNNYLEIYPYPPFDIFRVFHVNL